jgi:hypothetical protein
VDATPQEVAALLRSVRFNYVSEDELQRGIEQVLTEAKVTFEREVRLAPHDRIDFIVNGLGIEVKVRGATNEVIRQVQRYQEYERITAVMLVTTCSRHRDIPEMLRGKPVYVVVLQTGLL